jgi:hypothetical protein
MELKYKLQEMDELIANTTDKDTVMVLNSFRNMLLTLLGLSKSVEVMTQEFNHWIEYRNIKS